MVGMNPGPFGMAQTGVPFGDVAMVRDFVGVTGPVGKPSREHPLRPVAGFACARSEVSGTRFWGWARDRFGTAERFFDRVFVANWCPLVFMEASGRNRTPDKLPASERAELFAACDAALARVVEVLRPRLVVGVGRFAERRARVALGAGVEIGWITHPSPASPAANRDWPGIVDGQLRDVGFEPRSAAPVASGRCAAPRHVELMLLATVLLWALNLSVTKYILDEGLLPLSYATIRYAPRRGDLRRPHPARGAHAPDRAAASARAGVRDRHALAQPGVLRPRARQDDRVDDRAHPRRDPDLRGAVRSRPRPRAPEPALLARSGRSRSWGSGSSRSDPAARCPEATSGSCSGSESAPRGRRTPLPSRR